MWAIDNYMDLQEVRAVAKVDAEICLGGACRQEGVVLVSHLRAGCAQSAHIVLAELSKDNSQPFCPVHVPVHCSLPKKKMCSQPRSLAGGDSKAQLTVIWAPAQTLPT